MVKVAIIGWYGTETIGDRAILAGLINVISESFGDFEIQLGALYSVLSERTILEDYSFLKKCASHDFNISIFNSTKVKELKDAIKWCDLLIVGGGPIMDLQPMYMLSYAFNYAHRKKKKTALLGCGWGPLKNSDFISCAKNLVKKSDLTIFRDSTSVNLHKQVVPGGATNPIGLIDPAFIAASVFLDVNKNAERNGQICVNLRDVSYDAHYQLSGQVDIFAYFCDMLNGMADKYPEKEILLIPMHTFGVGGDDRLVLNKISRTINRNNINVQNNPLNLEETMRQYYNAYFCVGMRFHSIVLQTMLNGKNFILDYTNPISGKIISMMRQLNIMDDLYEERYISLHTFGKQLVITEDIERLVIPSDFVEQYRKVYIRETSKIIE